MDFSPAYNAFSSTISGVFGGIGGGWVLGIASLAFLGFYVFKFKLPLPASVGAFFVATYLLGTAGLLPLPLVAVIEILSSIALGVLVLRHVSA